MSPNGVFFSTVDTRFALRPFTCPLCKLYRLSRRSVLVVAGAQQSCAAVSDVEGRAIMDAAQLLEAGDLEAAGRRKQTSLSKDYERLF